MPGTPVEVKLRSPSRGISKLESEAYSPQRGRSTRSARVRLHFEETQEAWDSASSHKQERKRLSQGEQELVKAVSPLPPPAIVTERTRSHSVGSPRRSSGETHVTIPSDWLEDLRLTLNRPTPTNSRASSPVGKGGRNHSLPPDAAVLAAALAARLKATPSRIPQPRRATVDTSTRGGRPSRRSSRTPTLPPRAATADSLPSASKIPRWNGQAASASHAQASSSASAGHLTEVPLTPPRVRVSVPAVPAAAASSERQTAAGGMPQHNAASELTMLEKAVVVGAGLALYPAVAAYQLVRSPPSKPAHHPSGICAAALESAGAEHELDLHQPATDLSGRLVYAGSASSVEASAAASAPLHASAAAAHNADGITALSVRVPSRSNSLELHAPPADTAAAAAAAPVSAEHAAAAAAAAAQAASGASAAKAPAPVSTVIPLPGVSPTGPSPTIVVPAGFRLEAEAQQAAPAAEPAAQRTSGSSLRATYGSIPTAAWVGVNDAAAYHTAVAAALAELKATGSMTNPLASMPSIPEIAPDGGVATPASISAVRDNPLYGDAASPKALRAAAAAAAKQQMLLAPETPKQKGLKCRTPRIHSPTGSVHGPPAASRKIRSRRFAALLSTLAVLSVCGLGLLACVDPSSGGLSGAIGAARFRHVSSAAAQEAASFGGAAVATSRTIAAGFAAAAQQLPGQTVHAAAAAAGALRAAPAAALEQLRLAGSAGYHDLQLVGLQASRFGGSVWAAAAAAAAEASGAVKAPITWLSHHASRVWATVTAAHSSWANTCKDTALGAAVLLSDDWQTVSAAFMRTVRCVPTSVQQASDVLAAAASAGRCSSLAAARGMRSAATRAVDAVTGALRHLAVVTLPPEARSVAPSAGLWARISSGRIGGPAAAHPSAAAAPSAKPAASQNPAAAGPVQQQPAKPAAPRVPQAQPMPAGKPAAVLKRLTTTPAAAAPAAAFPAAPQQAAPKSAAGAADPVVSAKRAAATKPSRVAPTHKLAAKAALHGRSEDAAVAATSLGLSATTAAPAKPQLSAGASVMAGSPLVVGVVIALLVCAVAAAAAHYLGLFAGDTARATASDSSDEAVPNEDDVPMPDDGGADDGADEALFGAAFADEAPRVAPNRRRHTMATTQQGREFTWLRPNEVVTRAAAASAAGLDYLWLRSRLVIKLTPEARDRVAKSSDLAGLGRDTSFRSPMAALRNIQFEGRRRTPGGRDASATPPPTAQAAAAARRRQTFG